MIVPPNHNPQINFATMPVPMQVVPQHSQSSLHKIIPAQKPVRSLELRHMLRSLLTQQDSHHKNLPRQTHITL